MFRLTSFMVVSAILASCGGGRSEPAETAGPKVDPGKQCLEDARAARPKMPHESDKIEVSHILVRSTESRGADASVTRSAEQACLRALEALEMLNKGSSFADAVKKYSDAKGPTSGSLGMIGRDDADARFSDAAFSLDIEELSYVVESDAGYHIILRTK